MVHGACSSAGCFSMTDKQIAEIYAIARSSLGGGQRAIQMQSYPFKMTAENLAKHRLDPNIDFWKQLKEGSDHFEVTMQEPQVAFCGRRYVFNASGAAPLDPDAACPPLKQDPEIAEAVAQKAPRTKPKSRSCAKRREAGADRLSGRRHASGLFVAGSRGQPPGGGRSAERDRARREAAGRWVGCCRNSPPNRRS